VRPFKFVSEALHELLVFCAVGKKDFHPVGVPLEQIIAMHGDKGKTSPLAKRRRAKESESTELHREPP
jgi:hypothetical protein